MQQRQQSRLILELTLLCSVLHHVLGQVSMSSVGGLLSKLAVLRDTPQLLHRTALLVEHQVAPEGNTILLLSRLLPLLSRLIVPLHCAHACVSTLLDKMQLSQHFCTGCCPS
jgi:hypothetical protein